jgi:hypothetical protein
MVGAGIAGHSPGACRVQGQLDESTCAQLRRVVIVFMPVAGRK